jgi:hypothetical protein
MTYDEQVIWKVIHEATAFSGEMKDKVHMFLNGSGQHWEVNWHNVRMCWPVLVAYAGGDASEDDLRATMKEQISATEG